MKNSIEKRIFLLERQFGYTDGRVPGTIISRILTPKSIEWSLGLGLMNERKMFFTGKTISECVKKAEEIL